MERGCDMEFALWINALKGVIAKTWGWTEQQFDGFDAEAWRGYFNDGMSPEDAFVEDCSYA